MRQLAAALFVAAQVGRGGATPHAVRKQSDAPLIRRDLTMTMKRRNTLAATASAIALALVLGGPVSGVGSATADEVAANISRAATDLPVPLAKRAPQTVEVNLETVELVGQLDDGTTYRYWTFNGQVPGPMLRVRVGDTVKVNLTNHPDSWMNHNVDFHAVTGPHGGGQATMAEPGETRSFS